ncbi:ferredoxin--NADP reductase [Spongiivirga citrea]|uniref:2Fe-2S iron-sulfur cluster binding domain-containing protein n=2 Tax=Spongiivirga citrea TaxID=1481457 RepID=A0A6M0CSP3_9FLAO|nr:ferredoxin--NADP reductase [Spongiivirga citrea]NER18929.1 2Fe-2S iron-sulfur cluster binding domain-containing protein [Spongiivirga citrea]
MSQFHSLRVQEVRRETPSSVSILFEVPAELKSDFDFKAGQYITIKHTINNEEVRRAYSICSTPHSGELRVAVKEVADGTFSKYANNQLQAGDNLKVMLPDGRFIFEPSSASRNIAAFAAGSGITPILSIAKSVLEKESESNFVLVYGNKTPEETIFHNELQRLKEQFPDRFFLHLIYSKANEENALKGRIESSTVNYVLKNKYKDITFDAFYLCGPEPMINTVSEKLKENNIAEEKIFFELFTESTDTETIEVAEDGMTQVTVLVDDEETSFSMEQTKTILEVALENDVDAPYSCQGGVCSSCIGRITEGKAEMRQNNILTDSEVAEGLILTCQAQPTTAVVKVDYDDV